jgi:hypothetical protein
MGTIEPNYLLNDIGTELLNRKRADIADELTNDCIAEPVVIKVENVLDNLTKRIHQMVIFFLVEKNGPHNCRKDPGQESTRCT